MVRTPEFSSEPFGPTLEQLMGDSNATYRGLAAAAGLSAGYVNHLVHGNRPVPDDEVIERLASALEVEPDHFREYRLRRLTEHLEALPNVVDRLYMQLQAAPRA